MNVLMEGEAMKEKIDRYIKKKKREKIIKMLKENMFVILGVIAILIALIVLKILKKKAKKKIKTKIKESIKNKVDSNSSLDDSTDAEDLEDDEF